MANTEQEAGNVVTEFSLADLAGMNTDDFAVVKSRLPMAGIWTCLVVGAALGQNDPQPGKPPLFYAEHKFESITIDPVVKDDSVDPASFAGRKLSDRTTFWPDSFAQEIGLLKGKYVKVGLDVTGNLGGLTEQGGEPGWLDGAVGKIVKIKVRHFTDKNGVERAGIDWVEGVEGIEDSAAA
jgi:hypothetical protein